MHNYTTIIIIVRADILDAVNGLLLPLNSEPTDGPMITTGVSDNGATITHYWCGWQCSPCQAFFVRECFAPFVANEQVEIIYGGEPGAHLESRGLAALPEEAIDADV